MTSTPFTLLSKRSGVASDRPSGLAVVNGEVALCFGAADIGLYIEDSAGGIRKIGPNHYAATAPNSSPAGLTGNSIGETWVNSASPYYLQVWNGSGWQKVGAGFADSASSATSATTANTAITANTATLASGAILASGVVNGAGAPVVTIVSSGLPAVGLSGALVYNIIPSGTQTSGLYVSAANSWIKV